LDCVKTYDNNGKLIGEINTVIRQDGGLVITNTMWNGDRVTAQTITARDSQGKVTTETNYGGKLIP
jgi:shikimate 5-dehydrogenase